MSAQFFSYVSELLKTHKLSEIYELRVTTYNNVVLVKK